MVLIGVGAAVIWRYRVDSVSWEVARVLERQGLGPAEFAGGDLVPFRIGSMEAEVAAL